MQCRPEALGFRYCDEVSPTVYDPIAFSMDVCGSFGIEYHLLNNLTLSFRPYFLAGFWITSLGTKNFTEYVCLLQCV